MRSRWGGQSWEVWQGCWVCLKWRDMEWVNPHLHCLCPSFFYLVLAGHAGKGSLFVGRGLLFSPGLFFFFTIIFCQASLIRGLRLAGHCKGLFMPSSLSFSLPLSLCSVLSAYNDAAQQRKNIPCDKETYFMQDDLDEAAERKACQFKRSWLGQCSGLQDANFGYSQGMPCILLRMNRVKKKMDFKISEIQITVLWINFTINLLCEWHLVVILGKTERKPFVIGCLFHA